jgi:hypothetical protein
MSQTKERPPRLLEALLKFLAAFASIVVLISATFSAGGYLVLRSNANLLGITSVLHHSVGDYLYEGAYFFLYSLASALPACTIGNEYVWLLGGLVVLYLLGKNSKGLSGFFHNIATKMKISLIFKQSWMRWLCLLAAVFLIVLLILRIYSSLGPQDLFFVNPDQKEAQAEIAIRASAESKELACDYERAVLYVILSVFTLWLVGKVLQDREEKPISVTLYVSGCLRSGRSNEQDVAQQSGKVLLIFGKLFLYLLFAIELVLLPIKFGQSVYPNEFHQVKNLVTDKSLKGEMKSDRTSKDEAHDGTRWLIRENPDSYVLYYGKSKQLVIIPKSHVLRISLDRRRNIFESFAKDQE